MNNQKDMSNNDQEINRKRKNSNNDFQIPINLSSSYHLRDEEDKDSLTLSLPLGPAATRPRRLSPVRQQQPPPPPPPPPPPSQQQPQPPLSMQLSPLLGERMLSQHQLPLSPTYSPYMPHLPMPQRPPPRLSMLLPLVQSQHQLPLSPTYSPYMPHLPMPQRPPPRLSMQLPLVQSQHQLPLSPTYSPYIPPLPMSQPPPRPPIPVSIPVPPDSTSQSTMHAVHRQESSAAGPSQPPRRKPAQREAKSKTVPAPYPWATTHRATVHSFEYLVSNQMYIIGGEVQCKSCKSQYKMNYDLKEKFSNVRTFIAENKSYMRGLASEVWIQPVLPDCELCHDTDCVKPIISEKKRSINWLFLLLGQMLGCCTLKQLRYFCKHTKEYRSGNKSSSLYTTYIRLCKQLKPDETF